MTVLVCCWTLLFSLCTILASFFFFTFLSGGEFSQLFEHKYIFILVKKKLGWEAGKEKQWCT